jgi:hypothetical protein
VAVLRRGNPEPEIGWADPALLSALAQILPKALRAHREVFRGLARPLAPAGLDGSFYRGMRIAAVERRQVLGGPISEYRRVS